MPATHRWPTPIVLAAGLAMLVQGCGGIDGVDLNGGVFDYLGVSSKSQTQRKEPQVGERPGLVVPPRADRLPEPGSAAAAAKAESWPEDPEERRVRAASEAERRHAAFCEKALYEAKVRRDDSPIRGPNGMCNPSIFKAMTGKDMTTREGVPPPKAGTN
ncbi:MAG: hypothetical protein ACREC6_05535 [Hyphomicrobiaceae bacterium]